MSLNLRNEIVMEVQQVDPSSPEGLCRTGKFFRAHFPAGATYQECFEALRQFADKILEMSKAYEASQVPVEQQQAVDQAVQDALQQATAKQSSIATDGSTATS